MSDNTILSAVQYREQRLTRARTHINVCRRNVNVAHANGHRRALKRAIRDLKRARRAMSALT